jgi:hypothetical protein
MMTEDLEPLDSDPAEARTAARESAFAAAPFFWKDLELAPLAIGREGDWLLHCQRIGLPPLHEVINSGDAFLGHAQRLLFFCANPPRAWLAVWMKGGAAAPIILEQMIADWAARHIQPGDQIAVIKLALQIYDRSRITQATLTDQEEDDAEGNASGPAHVLNTSASSSGPAPASMEPALPAPHTSNTTSRKRKAGPSSMRTAAPTAARTHGLKKGRRKKPRSARR